MKEYAALIKVVLVIGAAFLCIAASFNIGAKLERLKTLIEQRDAVDAMRQSLLDEQARNVELNEQIRTLLDRPAARDTIREIVKTNPSTCIRPTAVADGLRQEIDSANQAIAASRGGNPVSGNPANRKH